MAKTLLAVHAHPDDDASTQAADTACLHGAPDNASGGAESAVSPRSDSGDPLEWLERREGLESDLFAGLG